MAATAETTAETGRRRPSRRRGAARRRRRAAWRSRGGAGEGWGSRSRCELGGQPDSDGQRPKMRGCVAMASVATAVSLPHFRKASAIQPVRSRACGQALHDMTSLCHAWEHPWGASIRWLQAVNVNVNVKQRSSRSRWANFSVRLAFTVTSEPPAHKRRAVSFTDREQGV